jgi:3-oxoacyl-[acyl-carrier-protein] synthase II
MTVYLTDYRTVSTTKLELLQDVVYPQRVHRFADLWRNKDSGMIYVPHRLAQLLLDEALVKNLNDNPTTTAFILAAGNTHFAGINPKDAKPTCLTYDFKLLPFTLNQVYAGRIAQVLGANDLVMTDASACASSLKVMTDVINLIEHQGYGRVIVLSLEDTITDMVLKFFGESGACLTWEDEQKGIEPSAFDDKNHGFYIGQGAVLAVFESIPSSRPKAILHGAGIASEISTNAIGQREDGQGFEKAIWNAFHDCYVYRGEIDIVKSHGTGTISNNKAEKAAIERVFDGNKIVVTSYKQRIGHTMGASGLLESCLLINDINSLVVPHIMGRTKKDEKYLSDPHRLKSRNQKFLSTAAGMGNIYAAAIFETI